MQHNRYRKVRLTVLSEGKVCEKEFWGILVSFNSNIWALVLKMWWSRSAFCSENANLNTKLRIFFPKNSLSKTKTRNKFSASRWSFSLKAASQQTWGCCDLSSSWSKTKHLSPAGQNTLSWWALSVGASSRDWRQRNVEIKIFYYVLTAARGEHSIHPRSQWGLCPGFLKSIYFGSRINCDPSGNPGWS